MKKPTFSIGMYDSDGDLFEDGIWLHYNDAAIKIAANMAGWKSHLEDLAIMTKEIEEAWNSR